MSAASVDRLPEIGRAFGLAGAAIGILGLLGWLFEVDFLIRVIPGRPPMMPSTAALLVLTGVAAALRSREAAPRWQKDLSACVGALVLVAAGAILAEYVLGVDLGIDQLLVRVATPGPFPGRPSPPTALALAVLGGALLVFDVATPRAAPLGQWLCLGAAALVFAALVGHLYGTGIFFRFEAAPFIGVAVHTGVAVLLIATGMLLEPSRSGPARLVTSSGPVGLIVRRLGVASVLTPVILGLALTRGLKLIGLRDEPLDLAVLTTAMAVVGGSIVAVAARPLVRFHSALEASRAGYRELLEHAPDGIFIADLEGRYVDVNTAGCRLLRCSREEILGKTIVDFLPPEDVARLWQSKEQLLGGGVQVAEWTMRRKDGSLVPVEVSAKIDPGGRWQGFVRDLTQRGSYLAEQRYFARVGEVLASTLDYREMMTLVAGASVPFLGEVCGVLVAEDGPIEVEVFHADPAKASLAAALARSGLTEHSLLRRTFETRQPVLVRDLPPDLLKRLARDEEHLRLLEAVGPTSIVAVPLLAHGRCHGAIGFSSTDPARRYGAEDLRLVTELGRRFALAVDNAFLYEELRLQGTIAAHLSEGVILLRATDAVIVYTNPRFEEMFGYAQKELLGRHAAVLNAPGALSAEQLAEQICGYVRRTGTWHGEIENIKKDGARFWCYASVTTFEHPQFGPVWVSLHTDISERKRLEEERGLALKEKEVLLKEIHHRVKNNLQVISSLFYLQAQRTQDPELQRLLDESRGRVQSIALVHEQLYRSRSLAGIDFGEYLKSLVAGIEATYSARKIGARVSARGVFLDIEHAVPCGLLVSELVSNAFKHGFPRERAGRVSVSVGEGDERSLVLEVADDGVGIPEGVDWRGSKTLGLQLVRSLTAQLRGTITLDRSSGTRFTVRFPSKVPVES